MYFRLQIQVEILMSCPSPATFFLGLFHDELIRITPTLPPSADPEAPKDAGALSFISRDKDGFFDLGCGTPSGGPPPAAPNGRVIDSMRIYVDSATAYTVYGP
jgi:hypothetical protein